MAADPDATSGAASAIPGAGPAGDQHHHHADRGAVGRREKLRGARHRDDPQRGPADAHQLRQRRDRSAQRNAYGMESGKVDAIASPI